MRVAKTMEKRVRLVAGLGATLPVLGIGLLVAACQPTMEAPATIEPMELQGGWLGMRLGAADSATARELGVASMASGVLVAEVGKGSRVMQSGITAGDVIVGVEGKKVQTLGELYTLTTRQNTAQPLTMEIVRQGQQLAVMVPAPLTPGMPPISPTAAGAVEAQTGALFVCPNDGMQWTQAQAGPDLRCPRCGGPLVR